MKLPTQLKGSSIAMMIALWSSTLGVQGQPAPEPVVQPKPRLTLTAEQEYTIREILKDAKVPKEKSATATVGDSVPENIKLYRLPSEIEQKVPPTKSHEFFVENDDTIIIVSPSDRRIADVLKKKPSD